MDRQSDLILDSKLETQFESSFTVHTYREICAISERRVIRKEYWHRESHIRNGAYGGVWLEKCVQGHRDVQMRAVKQLSIKPSRNAERIDYSRELQAIAKFSHEKSFGWYRTEESLFITMEYLPDGDLHQYLSKASPLGEEAAEYPNQIMSSSPMGTMGFIAPDLHGFTRPGTPFAADMWSLGEITFQLTTKQPVFQNLAMFASYATEATQSFPSTAVLCSQNISISGQGFVSLPMVFSGKSAHALGTQLGAGLAALLRLYMTRLNFGSASEPSAQADRTAC
ncbi:uncharacterized protein PV07_10377 [Cladophialophora immunda]|uniref:mitogen-activated protein kinase n=1 Tax=Cladophialophora immunda TaxID=569365 RepID=A0A0D2C2H6_9EURO|nr:uncharacterized protein PV07_10377 [Cladophialophora immunda]KIW24675.1 hypothetical protein PV07_10377 [Cladophialophora immunda]